jgi:hypothetical protein
MSEVEHQKGKITEIIPLAGEDCEDLAKRLLENRNIVYEDYYDSYGACLTDNFPELIVIVDGKIYEYEVTEIDPYADISNATMNPDGTIDFEVKYYNGSCGFGEAIEKAINKMNKD